jgi:hypothetical protein
MHLGEPVTPISGGEIHLERRDTEHVDSVTFSFEKYMSPRLQIHLSRRKVRAPHDWVHSGNLVARSSQYYHYWGKPWWLPSGLWSKRAAKRTAERILGYLDQAVRLIEEGDRG